MQSVEDPILPDFVGKFQYVTDYKEIDEVMRSPHFHQSGAPERRVFFGRTLIFAEGERHAELRERLRPIMSRQAMAYYELNLLEPVIDNVLAALREQRGPDGLVRAELVELVRIMLHQISAGVTGADGVDSWERTERFAALVKIVGEAATVQWTKGSMDEVLAEGREAMNALINEFLQTSLDRRLDLARRHRAGEIGIEDLPRDMLMSLCLADDVFKPGDDEGVPYIWQQCALFLNASIHATSQTLPHLIVHLDHWVRDHPEDTSKLVDPIFLRLAAVETLRLHQSSPVKFRDATQAITLSTGRQIAAGETVALGTTMANLDEKVFGADARVFNPYREAAKGKMPWGLTFGTGRHSCFGSNLVIGVAGKADKKLGTDGTLVKIALKLNEFGCKLDPGSLPTRNETSFHDAYATVPILFSSL